jgi:hypothetical protein
MLRSLLLAAAVVLGATACGTATTAATATTASTGPAALDARPATGIPHWDAGPGQFVSVRYTAPGSGMIALSDVSTGALVRDLLPATAANGMQVTGLALDRAGNLWITYSKGPVYRGDTAGGDPRPDSCANQVDVVQAGSGSVTVALRTSDNVLIWDAQPSPSGREIAYRESPCTGYEESYLRIKNISAQQQWSIGQGLPDCHLLSDVAWSADGRTLLADYGPASTPYSYGVNPGPCAMWWAGRLVQVSAGTAQPGLAGSTVPADSGCQIDAVGGTAGGGALAVEGCGGGPDFLTGSVSLLVIGANGRIDRRLPLGACVDGAAIAMNQAGTAALVSAYFTCSPSAQVTRLWEYRDGALRPVLSVPGDGGAVNLLAW